VPTAIAKKRKRDFLLLWLLASTLPPGKSLSYSQLMNLKANIELNRKCWLNMERSIRSFSKVAELASQAKDEGGKQR